jgi:hypothetical protein
MDEQPATQPAPAPAPASEPAPAPSPPPDRSPKAKDAAIAKLKEANPNVHFDTAYNMLRADPAFDPNDPEERVYVMQNWGKVKVEKPAETLPPAAVTP